MTHDLTTGKPLRDIWQFAVPVLFGLLLQQVYSLVDTAIVGHALGVMALGGVGATGSVNFLVIGFCGGLCTGMAIPLAQAFGAGDYRQLRRYVAGCVWLGIAMSALLLALTLPTTRALLKLMGTPEEQMGYAYDYIFIIFIGIPATILYDMGACVLRSLIGDSKSPVWFLAIASVINIVLDLLTVCVLGMGVAGAAIATVVSQLGSGAALRVVYAEAFRGFAHGEGRLAAAEGRGLRGCSAWACPSGCSFPSRAIGSVMLQSAVNSLGAVCVSGVAVASKIYMLLCCPFDALAMAATNFTGQNLGAGKYDRIRQGYLRLPAARHHLLRAIYRDRAFWHAVSGAAVHERRRGAERAGLHAAHKLRLCLRHAAAAGRQRLPPVDPGHGLQPAVAHLGSSGDDRAHGGGHLGGAAVRLCGGLPGKPAGVGAGRLLPDPGLLRLSERPPPPGGPRPPGAADRMSGEESRLSVHGQPGPFRILHKSMRPAACITRQIHGKVKPTPFHCIRACRQGISADSAARPKTRGGDRMKISTKGRYALRLLLDIAQNQQDGFVSLKEIAERQEVSKKYLEQIIPLLSRAELLQTSRGYQGGYRLCRAPEDYTVYEILSRGRGRACARRLSGPAGKHLSPRARLPDAPGLGGAGEDDPATICARSHCRRSWTGRSPEISAKGRRTCPAALLYRFVMRSLESVRLPNSA